jgi:hypothetical protein
MLKTKNKQGVNDVLEAEAAVKFTVWSCGKNAKLKCAKNITTAAMKRGTPRKRWWDEVEEDLSTVEPLITDTLINGHPQ